VEPSALGQKSKYSWMNRRIRRGLSARTSTRGHPHGSSERPPCPSAMRSMRSGPRRSPKTTCTRAVVCAVAMRVPAHKAPPWREWPKESARGTSEPPLTRPAGTLSPAEGEGRGEGCGSWEAPRSRRTSSPAMSRMVRLMRAASWSAAVLCRFRLLLAAAKAQRKAHSKTWRLLSD